MTNSKILLFRNWDNHPIVDSVVDLLQKGFPGSEIRVVTITQNIRDRKFIVLPYLISDQDGTNKGGGMP